MKKTASITTKLPLLLKQANSRKVEIISAIEQMVKCESPTDSPSELNRFLDLLVDSTRDIASPKFIAASGFGKHLRLEFKLPGRRKEGQILGLGHSDTVWPLGTLQSMPFRRAKGRLWGPGVLDMKAGLAFFLFAARLLRDFDIPVRRKVALLIVSDEELGSQSSRELTESAAQQSNCILVLEPGTGLTGKLKTARKGIAGYKVSIKGVASHAGVDFSNGASAIVELAKQIDHIASFTNLERGTTVNPGVIAGGTRTNVIAAEAHAAIDVRVARLRDADLVDRQFKKLRPFNKRCTLQVEGSLNRPPMERSKGVVQLFKAAEQIAAEMGIQIEESATGGGSDGNFTAALGIPTLDGLGAVGEGAHAPNESILINRIADRTALLAGLLSRL